MNLFWKKLFRILTPTNRYEKLEVDFASQSAKLKALEYSAPVKQYQETFERMMNASQADKKEYKKQLTQLAKHKDVAFLLRNKARKNRPHRPAYLSFSDDFYWASVEESAWNFGFYFRGQKLKRHYSFYNEKQANNEGRNTSGDNGSLRIQTKRETIQTLAWEPQKGFLEKEFHFTSDVVQTAKTFKQTGGVFKAKLRCLGSINHAFWLGTETMEPHINIFHYDGTNVRVGLNHKAQTYQVDIEGINPAEFYIYTLEWTKDELIWYINNIEVLRAPNPGLYREMYLNFNSFIPEKMAGSEGILEVDWVRVYQFV